MQSAAVTRAAASYMVSASQMSSGNRWNTWRTAPAESHALLRTYGPDAYQTPQAGSGALGIYVREPSRETFLRPNSCSLLKRPNLLVPRMRING